MLLGYFPDRVSLFVWGQPQAVILLPTSLMQLELQLCTTMPSLITEMGVFLTCPASFELLILPISTSILSNWDYNGIKNSKVCDLLEVYKNQRQVVWKENINSVIIKMKTIPQMYVSSS
jgi:hypothetical protein